MHALILTLLARPLFAADRYDLTAFFTNFAPAAVNCDRRLSRRPDRLAAFERAFPEEGRAFRQSFRWELVAEGGRRQLLGKPHKQLDDPPIFAVVPLDAGPNQSILTVTIHPRHPNLDQTLAREVAKLGKILSLVHRLPRTEFGISYPKGCLDIVLFETPSPNNTATLGQVMEFASTMAELCPVKDLRRRVHLVRD